MKVILKRGFFILSVCALAGMMAACSNDFDEIDPEDPDELDEPWHPELAEEDIPTTMKKDIKPGTVVVCPTIPEEEIPL